MNIRLITPAPPRSRAGNRATAARWATILRGLGHRVKVSLDYGGEPADMMVALHAWRSAAAIAAFAGRYPERPLVVSLTGTDAYRFIHSHPRETLRSIELAHRLVGLHDLIADTVPPEHRAKVRVIHQSARPLAARDPARRHFRVVVAGHLREEKDPLRPAMAVRCLPRESRIRVDHYGKAHTPEWGEAARAEMADNPRYRWHGEIPHHRLRQVFRRAHLMVLPSRMEGGANVISEAVVAGLPVVASRIAGSVGLLGEDYLGYYPVEDADALGAVLLRAEAEPAFYRDLERQCAARRGLFTPEAERAGWVRLLAELEA
ncbi:MAG: selenoneine biosynthesis selenosugar synthase SenB [Gammaproteobacteria bacterium]|nr:selenoneine biosynthesis selenosugar synthase SenB [Gammaproteobacteria bacterium]